MAERRRRTALGPKTRLQVDRSIPAARIDSTGREIRSGDLLRLFHFVGPRRKRYFQYFMAFRADGHWRAIQVYLIPEKGLSSTSGIPLHLLAGQAEIIDGYACEGHELSYEDRPR